MNLSTKQGSGGGVVRPMHGSLRTDLRCPQVTRVCTQEGVTITAACPTLPVSLSAPPSHGARVWAVRNRLGSCSATLLTKTFQSATQGARAKAYVRRTTNAPPGSLPVTQRSAALASGHASSFPSCPRHHHRHHPPPHRPQLQPAQPITFQCK